MKLIDDIINEPLIGAHRQKKEAFKAVGDYIINSINELKVLSLEERKEKRYEKLMSLGSFE
jgi:acetyl-CoA carboxylase carboxyl transferase subunit alpha